MTNSTSDLFPGRSKTALRQEPHRQHPANSPRFRLGEESDPRRGSASHDLRPDPLSEGGPGATGCVTAVARRPAFRSFRYSAKLLKIAIMKVGCPSVSLAPKPA